MKGATRKARALLRFRSRLRLVDREKSREKTQKKIELDRRNSRVAH
jgi:hypothetical protein